MSCSHTFKTGTWKHWRCADCGAEGGPFAMQTAQVPRIEAQCHECGALYDLRYARICPACQSDHVRTATLVDEFGRPETISPYTHELNGSGTDCAEDCPACRWLREHRHGGQPINGAYPGRLSTPDSGGQYRPSEQDHLHLHALGVKWENQ